MKNKTKFIGKSQKEALDKAKRAVGGDGNAIQVKFMKELNRQQHLFHCEDSSCKSHTLTGRRVASDCSYYNATMEEIACDQSPLYKGKECK